MKQYHYRPSDPIRDALTHILGKEPPSFVKGYTTLNLTDEENYALTTWVHSALAGSRMEWSTALGVIDAAEVIVQEAVNNANIPPES